jgi:hypothetical protein
MRIATSKSCIGLAALATCAAAALLVAPVANAAPAEQVLTCDGGQQLVIRANDDHSSGMGGWSAVQVVGGGSGTLIPTSFSGSAYDETTAQMIFQFSQAKGAGNANHNQPTVTCTQSTTAALGDLLEPGDELAPGTSLTDQVTMTFTATAVHQP